MGKVQKGGISGSVHTRPTPPHPPMGKGEKLILKSLQAEHFQLLLVNNLLSQLLFTTIVHNLLFTTFVKNFCSQHLVTIIVHSCSQFLYTLCVHKFCSQHLFTTFVHNFCSTKEKHSFAKTFLNMLTIYHLILIEKNGSHPPKLSLFNLSLI